MRNGWPRGVTLIHVTGITAMLSASAHAAVHQLFDLAAEHGALVSFDPNVRRKLGAATQWRETVGPLLKRAHLVFAGSDELEELTGMPADVAASRLLSDAAHSVIVKRPDHSVTLLTRDGQWSQPTRAAAVVDPVGAGDALAAGFLSARLGSRPPDEALEAGVAAAHVVGAVLDNEGLPNARELAAAPATAHPSAPIDR
ncbi:PfkB family carbohydrate kinase [Streptomyces shenzhenensis]|uniref:PfkB family carbohydrate kinase n=1 Tax=Streptomyces shenzhenensis TaxID=943815 RepID=UPI0033F4EE0A